MIFGSVLATCLTLLTVTAIYKWQRVVDRQQLIRTELRQKYATLFRGQSDTLRRIDRIMNARAPLELPEPLVSEDMRDAAAFIELFAHDPVGKAAGSLVSNLNALVVQAALVNSELMASSDARLRYEEDMKQYRIARENFKNLVRRDMLDEGSYLLKFFRPSREKNQ